MPEQMSSTHKSFSLTRARAANGQLNRSDRVRALVFSSVARGAVKAIAGTMRLRTSGEQNLARYRRLGPGSLLFALWHGDYFPVFAYARNSNVCVVVSRSPDGEILDRLLRARGFRTVRGSSTRGATRVVIDMARQVNAGHDAAIAVDGPRGPAGEAKAGIVLLAKRTGCPIVPLSTGMERFKEFSSWDRFKIPLPFTRVVLTAGPAIQVPRDATSEQIERTRLGLQQALHAQQAKACGLLGRGHLRQTDPPAGFSPSRTQRV
jgi:lysophospholipid acyltransferase (LPLAT)-like uncharacterized protein